MQKMDEMDGFYCSEKESMSPFHLTGNTTLNAPGITANIDALADKALCDERLSDHHHGHIEEVADHEFAAAYFLYPAETTCHYVQRHMTTGGVIERDKCAFG